MILSIFGYSRRWNQPFRLAFPWIRFFTAVLHGGLAIRSVSLIVVLGVASGLGMASDHLAVCAAAEISTSIAVEPAASAQRGESTESENLTVYLSEETSETLTVLADRTDSEPSSADLRSDAERWNLPRRDQGARGTCSVFAMLGAVEWAVGRADGKTEHLSVDFANWAKNSGRLDQYDGGKFSDIWAGIQHYGLCRESLMPYRNAFDPNVSPSAEALAEAQKFRERTMTFHWIKEWNPQTGLTNVQICCIRRIIANGWPVCVGLRWPKHPEWKDNVLQMAEPDAIFDGHSVLFVGYQDDENAPGGGYFIYRNTNRPQSDERMPYAYAKQYANDAAYITTPLCEQTISADCPNPSYKP